jgi:hypothetical protein
LSDQQEGKLNMIVSSFVRGGLCYFPMVANPLEETIDTQGTGLTKSGNLRASLQI